jgi:hypothetical protein
MVKREFGVAAPDGEVDEVFEEAMLSLLLHEESREEKCGVNTGPPLVMRQEFSA